MGQLGTRGRLLLVAGGAAIGLGAAGWLLGPGWAAAGVVVGPFAALVIVAAWQAHSTTSAAELLRAGRAGEALSMLDEELPSWRTLARFWPGQFRDVLASRLVDQSFALHSCGRDAEAVATADEAVLAFRELAAARPGKFTTGLADAQFRVSHLLVGVAGYQAALAPAEEAVRLYRGLAATRPAQYAPLLAMSLIQQAIVLAGLDRPGDALAAVTDAAGLYQAVVPADRYPYSAAQALLVEGRVLCDLSRPREAARPLARGWQLAASRNYQDLLRRARPALETAYEADPAGLAGTWHAETGTQAPGWLTRPDGAPGPGLRFPADSGIDGQVAAVAQVPGSGPPPVHLHHAGLEEVQAREEPADLGARARRDRDSGLFVVTLHALGHLGGGDIARDLGDGQVTARLVLVGNSLQDPQQDDRDRLPEVQDAGRPLQDRASGAQIGVDVGRPSGLLVSRARAWNRGAPGGIQGA